MTSGVPSWEWSSTTTTSRLASRSAKAGETANTRSKNAVRFRSSLKAGVTMLTRSAMNQPLARILDQQRVRRFRKFDDRLSLRGGKLVGRFGNAGKRFPA